MTLVADIPSQGAPAYSIERQVRDQRIAQFIQASALLVAQLQSLGWSEHIAHHAAAQATDAESSRLLGGR